MIPPHVDELLDLVDDDNNVIGTIWRSEARARGVVHLRGIHAFIQHSNGKILVPTRSKFATKLPEGLDFSISGYLLSGETYEQGLAREAREEMTIDIQQHDHRLLHIYNAAREPETTSFSAFYLINSDATPIFNQHDFDSVSWMHPQEVLDLIAQGKNAKKMIKPIIERFFKLDTQQSARTSL